MVIIPQTMSLTLIGQGVINLREHIHRRMLQVGFKAKTILPYTEHLKGVWNAIQSADFALNFKTIMERTNYTQMEKQLISNQIVLSAAYSKSFDKVSSNIKEKEAKIATNTKSMTEVETQQFKSDLETDLLRGVAEAIYNTDSDIERMKEDNRFKQWQVEIDTRWQAQKLSQKQQWNRYLTATFTTALSFSVEEEIWRKEMRKRMDDKFQELGKSVATLSDPRTLKINQKLKNSK